MNEEKNKKNKKFFADKGFYIVLIVCIAVIGIASWMLLFGGNSEANSTTKTISNTNLYEKADLDSMKSSTDTTALIKEPATEEADISSESEAIIEEEDSTDTEETSLQEETDSGSASQTYMWPVAGNIAVDFSVDELVYSKTMADWRTHDGIDIASQAGTKVMVTADGMIESIHDDNLYGTTIIVDHGGGIKSIYSNLAATPTVNEGDVVGIGTVIGSVGDTAIAEASEVSHLHFCITQDDSPVNPTDFLPSR